MNDTSNECVERLANALEKAGRADGCDVEMLAGASALRNLLAKLEAEKIKREALEFERDKLTGMVEFWETAEEAASAERDGLREALWPLYEWHTHRSADDEAWDLRDTVKCYLSIGELRQARAALKEQDDE